MNKIRVLFSLLILFGICITGCRKELEVENYQEIEKPVDLTLRYDAHLNMENVGDTVVAYYPYLDCEITILDSLRNFQSYMVYDDEALPVLLDTLKYITVPMDSGYHLLGIYILEQSFSGSIAANLGLEVKDAAMGWTIFVSPKPMALEVKQRTTNTGAIELYWEKPSPLYGEVDFYTIQTGTYYYKDTTKNNFFTLKYSGEKKEYHVTAYFTENHLPEWSGSITLDEPVKKPELIIEEAGSDSLLLRWNKIYDASYKIMLDNNYIMADSYDTSLMIKDIPFGVRSTFVVYVKFSYETYHRSYYYYYHKGTDIKCFRGAIGYNPSEDVLYAGTSSGLDENVLSYHLPDLEQIAANKIQCSDDGNIRFLLTGKNSSKMVAGTRAICETFSGKELTQIKCFEMREVEGYNERKVIAYDENIHCLCYITYEQEQQIKYSLFNLDLGKIEQTFYADFDIPIGSQRWGMSRNGKYFYSKDYYTRQFQIGSRSAQGISTIFSGDVPYDTFWFNPNNEEELYAKAGNTIALLNAADFSFKRSFNAPIGNLRGVDEKSGKILIHDYDQNRIYVISSDDGSIFLEMEANSYSSFYLYGNVLASDAGYALSLEHYPSKNIKVLKPYKSAINQF